MSPSIDFAAFADLQNTAGADFVVEQLASLLEDASQALDALSQAALHGDAPPFGAAPLIVARLMKDTDMASSREPLQAAT